jgi:glutathione S-transferase
MIVFWGRLNSLNVRKVAWCLEEIGAPYRRIEAGLEHGVVTTPDYLAMNPNGLVPTIRDGDFTLWESNAILRYLCAKHSEAGFWPVDPAMRALGDRWMDWQQTSLTPAGFAAFHGLVRTAPEKRDLAAIEASRLASEKRLAILDAHLADKEWLDGLAFGLAEFAVAPQIHRWFNMPVEGEARPHIARWLAAIMARPAAARTLTLPIT